MSLAMRMWFGAISSVFVAACGSTQQKTNDPGQPSGTQDSPVIVLGRPTPQRNNEPLQVAEEEPQMAVGSAGKPSKLTDTEISNLVRDPRREHWSPRATALVITEIQGLEALIRSLPATAPDRPLLMRRLANGYIELKFGARRDKQHALDMGVQQKPNEIQRLDKTAVAAQKMALKYFEMLTQQHPNFCQSVNPSNPNNSTGCVDDAFYFLGLEYLELDTPDQARKSFLKLIQAFPQSPWVPHAYLGFGELFLTEGRSDPSKLEFARLSYEQVLKFAPNQNETYGFANYRLAQVEHLKHEDDKALSHFVKAIEFSANFPALRPSSALGDAARREIASSYVAVGEPRKAEAFFRRLANDQPGSDENFSRMIDAVAVEYIRDKRYEDASTVCSSLPGGGSRIPGCRLARELQAGE